MVVLPRGKRRPAEVVLGWYLVVREVPGTLVTSILSVVWLPCTWHGGSCSLSGELMI